MTVLRQLVRGDSVYHSLQTFQFEAFTEANTTHRFAVERCFVVGRLSCFTCLTCCAQT